MWEKHNLYNKRHINKLNEKMTWNLFHLLPRLIHFILRSHSVHFKRLMEYTHHWLRERSANGWIECIANVTHTIHIEWKSSFSDWIPVIFMIIILHLSSGCVHVPVRSSFLFCHCFPFAFRSSRSLIRLHLVSTVCYSVIPSLLLHQRIQSEVRNEKQLKHWIFAVARIISEI